MNVLVQGASGGLGFELTRQYVHRADVNCVFATCRQPASCPSLTKLANEHANKLRLLALDVTDEDSIGSAATQLKHHTDKLHVLINVAGVLHTENGGPERRLEHLNPGSLAQYFATNATGPLLVAKHFVGLITHKNRSVLANISARVGSISDNRLGGWYGYRASKAAQNMMTKTLAIELKHRAPNVACIALHPGTVDTKLSKPFQKNVPPEKLFDPVRAARQLIDIIDSTTAEESGTFFDWQGEVIPW